MTFLSATAANGPTVSFIQPSNNQNYKVGDPVYVKVAASDQSGVAHVDLFIDSADNHVRRESRYPYEWSSQYDAELNNLQPGRYRLIAVAKDKRGHVTVKSIYIHIDERGACRPTSVQDVGFGKPATEQHFAQGAPIEVLAITTVDIDYVDLYLNDCSHHIRRESKYPFEWKSEYDPELRNLAPGTYKLIMVGVDNSGNTSIAHRTYYVDPTQENQCEIEVEFKGLDEYTHFPLGSDVYVELNIKEGREQIQSVQLFVDGQDYGTERAWPYQWGRGFRNSNPATLNNMQAGVYNLRCIIKDKCGNEILHKGSFIVDKERSCTYQFYNFEQANPGTPITTAPEWLRLTNYRSPVVHASDLKRKKIVKISKGIGAALDIARLDRGKYEIGYYAYLPEGKEMLFAFYDDKFETVRGFRRFYPDPGNERWRHVQLLIDLNEKHIQIYVDNKLGSTTYLDDDININYFVFHAEEDKHLFYVDDVYFRYNCLQRIE